MSIFVLSLSQARKQAEIRIEWCQCQAAGDGVSAAASAAAEWQLRHVEHTSRRGHLRSSLPPKVIP